MKGQALSDQCSLLSAIRKRVGKSEPELVGGTRLCVLQAQHSHRVMPGRIGSGRQIQTGDVHGAAYSVGSSTTRSGAPESTAW